MFYHNFWNKFFCIIACFSVCLAHFWDVQVAKQFMPLPCCVVLVLCVREAFVLCVFLERFVFEKTDLMWNACACRTALKSSL